MKLTTFRAKISLVIKVSRCKRLDISVALDKEKSTATPTRLWRYSLSIDKYAPDLPQETQLPAANLRNWGVLRCKTKKFYTWESSMG